MTLPDFKKIATSDFLTVAFNRGYAPARMAEDFNVSMQTLALWADGRGEPAEPLKIAMIRKIVNHWIDGLAKKGPGI